MRGLCYFILSIITQVYSTVSVIGLVGHNVTLPCSYDTQTYGTLDFCWGEGKVPRYQCSNTIVSWKDGTAHTSRGPRYQLLSSVANGNVSLTIMHAERSDAGVYGCRVEIPGWFNDQKVNIHLTMHQEQQEEPVTLADVEQGAQESITTSSFTSTEEGYILRSTIEEEKDFFSFLGVENVGRLAAVFFFTVIIILAFIFRRRLLPRKTLQQVDTSGQENVYESVPMH